jgi:predicted 3-demethylubiquinone-9 3-methyltransferase (glyoxalase superfamily)
MKPITPCLWFNGTAEDAARFYASVFPNSKIGDIARYPEAGTEIHGQLSGSVMTVEFELNGQPFLGLNGGPVFQFNEAISFQVFCETQEEIDHYWNKLVEGGGEHVQCGWLKDRFGLSWQVVPRVMSELMSGADPARANRVMAAMMRMKKLVIEELVHA